MHSVCVSSQLLVSMLFIAIPTNTELFNFFLTFIGNSSNIGSIGISDSRHVRVYLMCKCIVYLI